MLKYKNIIAFFIIALLGTLGHFVYEWTGNNPVIGLFFPVSESTWEHLKLLFYPTLIYSAVEYFLLEEKPKNYIPAVISSLFFGMFSIVALFYIYRGVIGKNIDFINITIYYVSVIITLCRKNRIIKKEKFMLDLFSILFLSLTVIFAVLFAVFSLNPPALGIFAAP